MFSAFEKGKKLEDILKYDLPMVSSEEIEEWKNPVKIEHPDAEIEIILCSSIIIISKNEDILKGYRDNFKDLEDLGEYMEKIITKKNEIEDRKRHNRDMRIKFRKERGNLGKVNLFIF